MSKNESIEEFYERSLYKIPSSLYYENGHFNVFKLEPFQGNSAKVSPYARRDYFKISLIVGDSKVEYADRILEFNKQALIFTNPYIPYRWDHSSTLHSGCFCIFDQAFFHKYGDLNSYSIFQPNGNHVFELTDEQLDLMQSYFDRLFKEVNSDFVYKNDLIRTIIYEIILFTLKNQKAEIQNKKPEKGALHRITDMFFELIERQFPIDDNHQILQLLKPSDYAKGLNIHVNYLNKAVKRVTGKTTSNSISEGILQEAKILLKQTTWNVSDIAYALGYSEITHFNNFFKKHTQITPSKFRNV